jgi:hypothetical protein
MTAKSAVRHLVFVLALATGAASLAAVTSAAGATVRTVTESANGHVITVTPGSMVRVVLHNTYWTIASPHGGLLREVGPPVVAGSPPGTPGCVVGAGCGTVTALFRALAPGQLRLSASRTSCGEALACTPAQGRWSIVVRVH